MPSNTVGNRLNDLERSIVAGEEAAEDGRWMQAEEVVRLLDEGTTQRAVAAVWISGRTGRPYSVGHVNKVAKVYRRFARETSRPRWADAYRTVEEGADEVVDAASSFRDQREAQPPTSVESAERLTQRLIDDAPDDVREAVEQGLRAHRHGQPVTRRERRDRHEDSARRMQPAIAGLHGASAGAEAVAALESAAEVIDEMIEQGSLTEENVGAIGVALDHVVSLMATARSLAGVES